MPYREKRIYSGAMLEIERVHCTSCGRIIGRRPRGLPTGKAQARINLRNAQLKLARLMCENFCRGDYHITLTFSQTMTREQQAEALAKLLRWLRKVCRKAGGGRYADGDLRYICVREDRGVRPHYHLVCQAFGLMVDELAEAWPWGRVEMGTLDGCPDYGWLARYLTKQEDQDKGRKRWPGEHHGGRSAKAYRGEKRAGGATLHAARYPAGCRGRGRGRRTGDPGGCGKGQRGDRT